MDDGSGLNYKNIFDQVQAEGCQVLHHEENKGKGCALKTGFTYINNNRSENRGIITADSDGQHVVKDILKIAEAITKDDTIVLGVRNFSGNVPLKSRFGNWLSYRVFKLASDLYIRDTQTGLRGFPVKMLPWLISIPGNRFEYEMNVLLQIKRDGYLVNQLSIDTVYIEGNKSTHFHAFRDSFLVMLPFFKFCTSSLLSAVIDYLLFLYCKLLREICCFQ